MDGIGNRVGQALSPNLFGNPATSYLRLDIVENWTPKFSTRQRPSEYSILLMPHHLEITVTFCCMTFSLLL